MEEDIKGMWDRIADILDKYATPSDFALFNEVLEELVKTTEEQQIIIGLMAKDIAENKLAEDICRQLRDPKKEECYAYMHDENACFDCVMKYYEKKVKGE